MSELLKLSQISLVTINYFDSKVLQRELLQHMPKEVEFIQIDNPNNENWTCAAAAFNWGIRKATNDIVICAHEDINLRAGWFDRFVQQEASLKNWGALGILGIDWFIWKQWWGHMQDKPMAVPLLDECCIVLNKRNGLCFDEETFDHWHCYGLDFCLQCRAKGLGVYIVAGPSRHFKGKTEGHPDAWRSLFKPYFRKLQRKWSQKFPQLKF